MAVFLDWLACTLHLWEWCDTSFRCGTARCSSGPITIQQCTRRLVMSGACWHCWRRRVRASCILFRPVRYFAAVLAPSGYFLNHSSVRSSKWSFAESTASWKVPGASPCSFSYFVLRCSLSAVRRPWSDWAKRGFRIGRWLSTLDYSWSPLSSGGTWFHFRILVEPVRCWRGDYAGTRRAGDGFRSCFFNISFWSKWLINSDQIYFKFNIFELLIN